MLIRSQSGNSLLNLDSLVGIGINEAFDGVLIMGTSTMDNYKLGKYSSKQKALKVLDMIEEEYKRHIFGEGGQMFTRDLYVPAFAFIPPKLFHMPADDEVLSLQEYVKSIELINKMAIRGLEKELSRFEVK